jgi:hypothetical protein
MLLQIITTNSFHDENLYKNTYLALVDFIINELLIYPSVSINLCKEKNICSSILG